MPSLKDVTRRHLVAEDQVPMECVGGEIWIKPKKWSEEADDKLRAFGMAAFRGEGGRESLKKLRRLQAKYADRAESGELEDAEVGEDDIADLAQIQAVMSDSERRGFYAVALLDGVGHHNIDSGKGELVQGGFGLDKKTVDQVLDWKDLAEEMFEAVRAYNRPLAKGSDSKSTTSPSGSTPERSSPETEESSQTEPTPSN